MEANRLFLAKQRNRSCSRTRNAWIVNMHERVRTRNATSSRLPTCNNRSSLRVRVHRQLIEATVIQERNEMHTIVAKTNNNLPYRLRVGHNIPEDLIRTSIVLNPCGRSVRCCHQWSTCTFSGGQ